MNVRIGVNCFVIINNKILLGRRIGARAGSGQWGFPGGHLEFGEDLAEAAARELQEETGLTAKKIDFLQIVNNTNDDEYHYVQINFLVSEWEGVVKNMEPEKCEEWRWFDFDAVPENIFYAHRKFIPAFKAGINFVS